MVELTIRPNTVELGPEARKLAGPHGIEYELGSAKEPWTNHSLQLRTWSNGSPLVCEKLQKLSES
jgi:hypothetical protein